LTCLHLQRHAGHLFFFSPAKAFISKRSAQNGEETFRVFETFFYTVALAGLVVLYMLTAIAIQYVEKQYELRLLVKVTIVVLETFLAIHIIDQIGIHAIHVSVVEQGRLAIQLLLGSLIHRPPPPPPP
jgi:hypothetical protein